MKVLPIVCYIIGLSSAFILIIFRIAQKQVLYMFFFRNVLSVDFTVILFRISCHIRNTNNTHSKQSSPNAQNSYHFVCVHICIKKCHSLTRSMTSKIAIYELLNEHSWRQTVRQVLRVLLFAEQPATLYTWLVLVNKRQFRLKRT